MSVEREEEEERAKVSVNNGKYIRLNQFIFQALLEVGENNENGGINNNNHDVSGTFCSGPNGTCTCPDQTHLYIFMLPYSILGLIQSF